MAGSESPVDMPADLRRRTSERGIGGLLEQLCREARIDD
jgi:hypothetical protein